MAEFNLNVFSHVNRLLGSDFKPQDWEHEACFDPRHSRIEMHLRARHGVMVCWPQGALLCAGRDHSYGKQLQVPLV